MKRSLEQWLEYLESIHPVAIEMGLDRVKQVATALQFDWSNIKVITVGGTNGKGTTCCALEHMLIGLGHSVATYRSPHLLDYRERVTLNGQMLDEPLYAEAMQCVEHARGETSLTYFEFGTLAAMVMIQQWQPEYALLEVGLGGRLDATNIVDADCAVITSIGIDHHAFLGNTRESVATEKAGIFRAHQPVVIGEPAPPLPLSHAIEQLGAQASWVGRDYTYELHSNTSWSWRGQRLHFDELTLPNIPVQNMSTALAILEALQIKVDWAMVNTACEHAKLPGRRQLLRGEPSVLVDVGHNPHAAKDLVSYLNTNWPKSHFRLVVGMLADKAVEETLACFTALDATAYAGTTQGPRGLSADRIQAALSPSIYTSCAKDIVGAFNAALTDANATDCIVVFGSFLTVADVLAYCSEKNKLLGE